MRFTLGGGVRFKGCKGSETEIQRYRLCKTLGGKDYKKLVTAAGVVLRTRPLCREGLP